MKLIFAGTPEFAAVILEALLATDHEVLAVYTQPDRPAGRGRKMRPGPVKDLAQQANITIRQPERLSSAHEVASLLGFGADAIIVAAYGLLLPTAILNGPVHGCINVHASLLPRWRGASPIQQAILSGDDRTGITIMQMDKGLDTGAILRQCSLAIQTEDTAASLHDRLVALGSECLVQSLNNLHQDRAQARTQDSVQATYARRLDKAQARIDWRQSAQTIERAVRAYNSWPVAHTLLPGKGHAASDKPGPGNILRIHRAQTTTPQQQGQPGEILQVGRGELVIACGQDALKLLEVQLAGRRRLPADQFLHACTLTAGDVLR